MTRAFAVRMPRASLLATGALRLHDDLEVLDAGEVVWLRGRAVPGDTARDGALARLPGAVRHDLSSANEARLPGRTLTAARLPVEGWRPLVRWLELELQPALSSGALPAPVALRLVPSAAVEEPGVLVAAWADWAAWATQAPAARLAPLEFARREDGRTVIRGRPLPPVRGAHHVERAGVAVPCGLALAPDPGPAELAAALGIAPGDLALFDRDGAWDRVPGACFAPATPAHVRAAGR